MSVANLQTSPSVRDHVSNDEWDARVPDLRCRRQKLLPSRGSHFGFPGASLNSPRCYFGAPKDFSRVDAGLVKCVGEAASVARQAAGQYKVAPFVDSWYGMTRRERDD